MDLYCRHRVREVIHAIPRHHQLDPLHQRHPFRLKDRPCLTNRLVWECQKSRKSQVGKYGQECQE
jgi:hypothetical protein